MAQSDAFRSGSEHSTFFGRHTIARVWKLFRGGLPAGWHPVSQADGCDQSVYRHLSLGNWFAEQVSAEPHGSTTSIGWQAAPLPFGR
jgi:hypothetical protein